MKINRLLVLLPCHGLENLEIECSALEAAQILSAWTALYHPALIHAAHSMPGWLSAHNPSQESSESLVILPECCEALLPEEWLAEAQTAGAAVLRNIADREALAAAALERLDERPPAVDSELVADFHALGYCHLMVELLTRKLRYMSNLDESAFRTSLLAAAEAAAQGDGENARTHLQGAFDRLHDAREYFYPTEPRLLDLTLLASTTLGESLRKELQASGAMPTLAVGMDESEEYSQHAHDERGHGTPHGAPRNFLLTGEVLEEMAAREPQSLAALKAAISQKTAGLIGGEYAELPLPLLPPEAIAKNLEKGIDSYERHLACRPTVYGRRKFGLTLALPRILEKHGFSAALHFTLDDGQFPAGNQSRIQWEGFDGGTIEALARIPLDADKADSFLSLPQRLGNGMELDHAPVQVFAHWPGRVSPWYDDLRRITSYSRVLGYFCTIDEFFEQTQFAGQRVQYQPDQYRSPYLMQDAAEGSRDAISRWVRYYRRESILESIQTLNVLTTLLSSKYTGAMPTLAVGMREDREYSTCPRQAWTWHPYEDNGDSSNDRLDRQLQESLDAAVVAFAENLRGKPAPSRTYSTAEKGYLLVNPLSFSRREGFLLPELAASPECSDAVRAADEKAAVVDLPSMGFVWIGSGGEDSGEKAKPKAEPPLADEHRLRNEFFEIKFDPSTGAIRAVSDFKSRHPRLAQQLALRMPRGEGDPTSDENYSIMAADEFRIASSSSVLGEMLCRGRLMDREGQRVAGFQQTTRVWRGSRVIEIEIEIDPERLPDARPWNSYYACRFAWHDEYCDFFRSVNLANQPTGAMQLESPLFIDIRSGKLRTTILGGGLPHHRRIGPRKLDSLLIVQGESARKFRIGVGIDVPNPTVAALSFIAPPIKLFGPLKPPARSGWLFHLDHRNVIATSWLPLSGESSAHASTRGSEANDGQRCGTSESPEKCGDQSQSGFRVRLLETEGRPAQLKLRCLRSVVAAAKLETGDAPPAELNVEGDTVHIPMGSHQWIDVEVLFDSKRS
ncbi:MAG: hypothetical protein IT426_03975 [Pirellulales bacterium]|nr:hypothetical protein [Pirellulales bacterium]